MHSLPIIKDLRQVLPFASVIVGVESLFDPTPLFESFEDCCRGRGGFCRMQTADSSSFSCLSFAKTFELFAFLTISGLLVEVPEFVMLGKAIDSRFCWRRVSKSLAFAKFLPKLLAGSSISVVIVDKVSFVNDWKEERLSNEDEGLAELLELPFKFVVNGELRPLSFPPTRNRLDVELGRVSSS